MTNTLYSTKAISYQVNDSLLAGNNSIWANRPLTKNLVSQSAKIYANQAILATNGGWDNGKHSKCGEFTPFAKGDLSHLSKEVDYPHWQDLRVTNSYAQKKKDSVQAVLIQLHTDLPSLRGEVSRLPNNIGLPDYIGLVKYCQSSIGGWDLNLVNDVHSVVFFNLSRQASLTHELKLPFPAAAFICSNSSSSKRMCFIVLPDLSNDFFSFFSCIGNYRSYNGFPYGNYHYYLVQDKLTTPRSATNTVEAFNHNVKESYDMAMYKSTQTHPKFKWRFFSCQQSKYFSVEATSEQEARSMLPDSPCLFSARIRKEVAHG